MTKERLSNRQIQTLKHLAMVCNGGGQVTLTRDQREAMVPLWRRQIVEIWYRHLPGERPRGPYFRLTDMGQHLTHKIMAASRSQRSEAA
ncbi:hypothetical protein [Bradyrhizobium sp. ORS 86]|uniref:hypothetical protein n=1 Tax=Bradyrhizobium sp. ORS 86 TaxID=1685970 RepID=UPI00388FFC36